MKAYKVTLIIVDHDELGAKAISRTLEHARYPNRCIGPDVVGIVEKDIGVWTDGHTLNNVNTDALAFFDKGSKLQVEIARLREETSLEGFITSSNGHDAYDALVGLLDMLEKR